MFYGYYHIFIRLLMLHDFIMTLCLVIATALTTWTLYDIYLNSKQ